MSMNPRSEWKEETLFRGVRYSPTDEELIGYLRNNSWMQKPHLQNYVRQLDLYKYHPNHLIRCYGLKRDAECYIITRRSKIHKNGSRPRRLAGSGFWKPTGGGEIPIKNDKGQFVGGVRKALTFHEGKYPGIRTKWMMQEYQLEEVGKKKKKVPPKASNDYGSDGMMLDGWVLCKIYKSKKRGRMTTGSDQEDDDLEQEDMVNQCDPTELLQSLTDPSQYMDNVAMPPPPHPNQYMDPKPLNCINGSFLPSLDQNAMASLPMHQFHIDNNIHNQIGAPMMMARQHLHYPANVNHAADSNIMPSTNGTFYDIDFSEMAHEQHPSTYVYGTEYVNPKQDRDYAECQVLFDNSFHYGATHEESNIDISTTICDQEVQWDISFEDL